MNLNTISILHIIYLFIFFLFVIFFIVSVKKDKKYKAQEYALKKRDIQIMKIQKEVIISVANLIESRDGTTGEHVKKTNSYVGLLLQLMRKEGVYREKLTDEYVENLCNAAPMHDIGKITIPDRVLQKPDKLIEEEIQIMNTHTTEGGNIIRRTLKNIEDSNYMDIACNVAMYHHEKWDGTGYPSGLRGENIPLEARIMAIADVFDAITSERQYKKAMSLDEAYEIMEKESGTHFDPKILEVFLKSKEEFKNLLERL